MKRIELFEFSRLKWTPKIVREAILDFLEANDGEQEASRLEELPPENQGSTLRIGSAHSSSQRSNTDGTDEIYLLSIRHLNSSLARKVLTNAAWERQPISIVEVRHHPFKTLLKTLVTPLEVVRFNLTNRPLTFGTIVLNLALPIIPLATTWDFLSETLRSYNEMELEQLAEHIHVPGYRFKAGTIIEKGHPTVIYLTGYPELRKAA